MENEINKTLDWREIEDDIVALISKLENCSIDDFLILFNSIVYEFDRVFEKYDIKGFQQALENPKIKSFRDLLK